MSWVSASVAPSGRHVAIRLSPTRSSACIWSAQLGSAAACRIRSSSISSSCGRSAFDVDVEVADVEVVVGAQLRRAQAELLGGVAVRAVGAGAVGSLPVERSPARPRAQLEAEERRRRGAPCPSDRRRARGGGRRGSGPRRAAPVPRWRAPCRRGGARTPPRPSRCRSRSPLRGREDAPTRGSRTTAPTLAGSRWVMTKRTSG